MQNIELKAGIEIHQQLDTHKLFCNCPSLLRQDTPDFEIKRKLHAVKGEQGDIDEAVKFETGRERTFTYQGYDTTCLIELDEEPPKLINQEALHIALQIALLLNCEILQNTQVMRKTVIDGSNTSGFQRTVIIARNGYIETNSGKVRIQTIALEEDAARIISQENNKVIYRLDRLGIPLVEIATMPDIKTPEQAKQTALQIGEILRACKVKRGLGTIRQDVNLSIKLGKKQGERIEVKGVQDPRLIAKTIETESKRQSALFEKNESKPEVRKANEDGSTSFLRPLPGSARMYPETDLPLLHITKQMLDKAKRDLPKLKSEIIEELAKQGLSEEMNKLIISKNKILEFKELSKIYKSPNLIAKILALWPQEIAKKENKTLEQINQILNLDIIESILQAVKQKKILESDIKTTMQEIVQGKTLQEALKKEKAEQSKIEEEIVKIIKAKPGLSEKAYMGLIMQKFKGKVNGKEVMQILKKYIK